MTINGSIAFVSQQAWIFSASLRQNVLFGQEFKQDKYDEIVQLCALDKVRQSLFYSGTRLPYFYGRPQSEARWRGRT